MKKDINEILCGEDLIYPVYVDSDGNFITVIDLVKEDGYLVARISQKGDVESLVSFKDKERAVEILKEKAQENDWKLYRI